MSFVFKLNWPVTNPEHVTEATFSSSTQIWSPDRDHFWGSQMGFLGMLTQISLSKTWPKRWTFTEWALILKTIFPTNNVVSWNIDDLWDVFFFWRWRLSALSHYRDLQPRKPNAEKFWVAAALSFNCMTNISSENLKISIPSSSSFPSILKLDSKRTLHSKFDVFSIASILCKMSVVWLWLLKNSANFLYFLLAWFHCWPGLRYWYRF